MQAELSDYIRAGFAGIWLVTFEEVRAEALLARTARDLGYSLHSWSVTGGLVHVTADSSEPVNDPLQAAMSLGELPEKSILVLRDFQQFLGDAGQPADPVLTRTLREQLRQARCSARVAVVLGCRLQLPPELEKDFVVLHLGLPDRADLRRIGEGIAASAGIAAESGTLDDAAEAARGLTSTEAEDIMALSVVRGRPLDPLLIAAEKARSLRKGGLLEIVDTPSSLAEVGGIAALKAWILRRSKAFSPEAAAFGLPVPHGILLLGIPGTGKSLTARAVASALGKPLLRLDAGRLFAGVVGESEANLRRALAMAEAAAPCILMVDELEKGLSGSRSSGATDGGTAARVFGTFLTWLQEKESPVFVVATANDISQLPPELLRKGRIDEIFFLDLPGEAERAEIWRIHVARRNRDPEAFDLAPLVRHSDGFTGSEIEQAFVDALYAAYDAGREVCQEDVCEALKRTVPLSVTMAEDIRALRQWAAKRTRSASAEPVEVPAARRIAA